MTSMLLFVLAGMMLLTAPLLVLLVWALVKEQRNRTEWRERTLQAPMRAREQQRS